MCIRSLRFERVHVHVLIQNSRGLNFLSILAIKADVRICALKKALYCYCFINFGSYRNHLMYSFSTFLDSTCTMKGGLPVRGASAGPWTPAVRGPALFMLSKHYDYCCVYTSVLGFQDIISTIFTFGFTATFPILETVQIQLFLCVKYYFPAMVLCEDNGTLEIFNLTLLSPFQQVKVACYFQQSLILK